MKRPGGVEGGGEDGQERKRENATLWKGMIMQVQSFCASHTSHQADWTGSCKLYGSGVGSSAAAPQPRPPMHTPTPAPTPTPTAASRCDAVNIRKTRGLVTYLSCWSIAYLTRFARITHVGNHY